MSTESIGRRGAWFDDTRYEKMAFMEHEHDWGVLYHRLIDIKFFCFGFPLLQDRMK